jgi:peptide methionine sulfoxide reductase msrA/msrB
VTKLIWGNLLMIICSLFYLAWWTVAFRPDAEAKTAVTGPLLGAAFAFGIAGVVMLCGELNGTPKGRTLFPGMSLFIGGIAVYFILLALTGILMKRMVTTELFLIVAWAVLELSVINSLYSREAAGRTVSIVFCVIVCAAAAAGLYCYLLYYGLDARKGWIDGMIPLILVAAVMAAVTVFTAAAGSAGSEESAGSDEAAAVKEDTMTGKGADSRLTLQDGQAVIYVAGGCFWGTEKLMSSVPGVIDAVSGYANGNVENPTYEQVCMGGTHFRETVRVVYDPAKVSLETLLYAFFSSVDTTARERQGNDVGEQYQSGVYYTDEQSAAVVNKVAESVKARGKSFYTEIKPLENFYPAEDYHQDYLVKNPDGYCHITPAEIRQVSGIKVDAADYTRPDDAQIKAMLQPEQYEVTQQEGTEPAFDNAYWDFHGKGIYVDVVTGEPLFTSTDKYDSSCGWPAFDKPIDENVIVKSEDTSFGMTRTEVKSRVGASHLGHVFMNDDESPTGTHYCIDSAALRFVPYEKMDEEGYGALKSLLE